MLHLILSAKKFLPTEYVQSIFDIDFNELLKKGKRLILTDLDNTLISYRHTDPTDQLIEWKNNLESMGFEIIVISNSKKARVSHFANLIGLKYVPFAKKPLKFGFKKALKIANKKYNVNEVIELGDQLMTDIYGSRRMKIDSILVKVIDKKTEYNITKLNRFLERKMLTKISKKYPEQYSRTLKQYVSDIYEKI
ncbi:MAG: YqeG family HAD IIIA-type phosphatase [Anaeroplasmataceae bacterium]